MVTSHGGDYAPRQRSVKWSPVMEGTMHQDNGALNGHQSHKP